MANTDGDPLWYKDAIIYQLHVKAFFDFSGDGVGDFRGLTEKLDYLVDLGVTAIWLLPFYPSPLRDDGYDIADYRNVHEGYGTMRDFRAFVREAHRRGLKVITELVINHTSDQHPWFQRAKNAKPKSRWREYYVWSDSDQKYQGTRIIFCDTEISNWTWDPVAQAYYWHRFFAHQPDLNFDNPRVFDEVVRVMKFWLDCGVDGLRLDAIPYLCEREGTNNENLPETHAVIKRLRAWMEANFADRMLLGEANQWPEDVRPYFGDGDECHMAFHFPLMPRMYMALAQEDRHPITDIMRQTPEIPETCQWAIFLRNHDELTLEMVTDRERDYLWRFYAADPRARINMGIRRRLAPLLERDRRKIELLNSLLMSMPGTPIIYYGDEIGMGDNIFLGDRDGVRTPMQWSPDRNAGFSRADPERLYLPPVMDSIYGFESVNVESQLRLSTSQLSWMKRLIAVRKAHAAFGRGTLTFLYPGNRKILAYLRTYDDETVLCVANMSRAPQPAELDLSAHKGRMPVELLGQSVFPPIGDLPYFITISGYGFYWFLLADEAKAPSWYEPFVEPLPELQTLVLPHGWPSLIGGQNAEVLRTRILPEFLPKQRWFAAKGSPVTRVAIADQTVLAEPGPGLMIACLDTETENGTGQKYLLPLAITWETAEDDPVANLQAYSLAKVRRGPSIGALHDAMANAPFTASVVRRIREGSVVDTASGGRVAFTATQAMESFEGPFDGTIDRLGREQSNTSMLIGEQMILKVFRRLEPGVHPELEIGRFLTDVAGFGNVPPLLGSVELVGVDGQPTALAVLQKFVRNQGDGWGYALDYLDRVLGELEIRPAGDRVEEEVHLPFLSLVETLGTRVAEMHRAFALPVDDPAFAPEPANADDLAAWGDQVRLQACSAHEALSRTLAGGNLPGEAGDLALRVLRQWQRIDGLIDKALPKRLKVMKTRLHGDFHLGQVVVVKNDFHILDFEGEPARPLSERRAKHAPLRDVAGMVRSFDYAGWAALNDRVLSRPQSAGTIAAAVETWKAACIVRFLKGYRQAIGDCPSVPSKMKDFDRLLDLFVLDKALYEICYEAANRPDWLPIPLEGVARLIGEA